MGLQSGKDIQRPAEFFPANARWSDAIAVNTTLYTSTSGNCAGTPNGVWGIDLESDAKPVVSWKSKDDLVGTLAFTSDGTVVVARTNGIVILDGRTLQEKGSFSASGAEMVTGPIVFRHHDKEIVAAGTKDGRIVLVDAAASSGGSRATPLYVSNPIVTSGSIVDALATWQEMTIAPAPAPPAVSPTAAPPPGPAATRTRPRTGQHHARHSLDPRARHGWDGCAEADGIEPGPGARTGLDGARLHGAGDADRGSTASCSVCRRDALPPRPRGRARGAARVRRNDRQGALEQQQRDEVVRFSGQLLERDGPTLRRHRDGTVYAFGFVDERR
jgi:hypothetical protein